MIAETWHIVIKLSQHHVPESAKLFMEDRLARRIEPDEAIPPYFMDHAEYVITYTCVGIPPAPAVDTYVLTQAKKTKKPTRLVGHRWRVIGTGYDYYRNHLIIEVC